MIDLHTHSSFSDGTLTPYEIVKLAEKRNIYILALTDHDTVDGINDFLDVHTNVTKIPGVEISLENSGGTFHMIGLFIDHKNKNLSENLNNLKRFRKERNEKILQKLSNFFGEKIFEHDISSDNMGELGRPHIAKFLIKKGVVNSVQEAFDKFLAKGRPFYEKKSKLDTDKAIQLIHDAGGIAVIAHPITLNLETAKFMSFIKELKDMGVDGIEAICPLHNKNDCDFYLQIAKDFDLIVTGGSDFHGSNKDDVQLGNLGVCKLNKEQIDKILEIRGR